MNANEKKGLYYIVDIKINPKKILKTTIYRL
jgi:hypothetical protein